MRNTEHDFSLDREQWEEAVVRLANQFVVFLPVPSPGLRREYDSLREALIDVVKITRNMPEVGSRAIVYAVTESGRFVMIPRKDWVRALHLRGEAAKEG